MVSYNELFSTSYKHASTLSYLPPRENGEGEIAQLILIFK